MADGQEKVYGFQGDGSGAYANSRLRMAGYNMPSNVIGQSRAYHADGETRLLDPNNPVSEKQMGML